MRPGNRIAVLPQGQLVTKLGEADDSGWWRVSTEIQNVSLVGFVAQRFLTPASAFVETPALRGVGAVHLRENDATVTRDREGGRAFPLGEPGRPARTGATPESKAQQLAAIIDWLQVEQRKRYEAAGGLTFCNIYAYDYCYLAGVYLPRVWWKPAALQALMNGEPVAPRYNQTLEEKTANALFGWLEDHGPAFGWVRVFDLTKLQAAANLGEVCIICAQRVSLEMPGHICAVVPEADTHRAIRAGSQVTAPLQSQAGSTNFRYGTATGSWWTRPKFRRFGFWRHG